MEKSGLLLVNKEKNMTSHDCVNIVRRSFNTKKVGHAGTLDPMATGLLPICIGKATKTVELISMGDKEYTAEFLLGITTDTLDITGEVLTKNPPEKDEEKIISAINSFKGGYMQLPPMYSAKKINGKKLYELAREGKEVEREPRRIEINEIEVLAFDLANNRFTMRVACSKGTYIRTLCQDIGRELGCFGHMSELLRTKSGRFGIKEAYTLSEVEDMMNKADLSFLQPIDKVFEEYPAICITDDKADRVCNGVKVRVSGLSEGSVYRVYDQKNNFLTISRAEDGRLTILKTFYQITKSEV